MNGKTYRFWVFGDKTHNLAILENGIYRTVCGEQVWSTGKDGKERYVDLEITINFKDSVSMADVYGSFLKMSGFLIAAERRAEIDIKLDDRSEAERADMYDRFKKRQAEIEKDTPIEIEKRLKEKTDAIWRSGQ